MSDKQADRPIVTFAVIAYNQEKFIREAVEGAFAQTYEPLEIILSDDCSSDRTFKIIQEMAAGYDGPHDVRVQKNEVNLGLIGHVNHISATMNGSIIIFAAGDDISLKSRAEHVASIFMSHPNVVLVHSDVFTINEHGAPVGEISAPQSQSLEQIMRSASIYIGATGAIHKCLLDSFEPIKYKKTYEDLTFGTRAALIGDITHIKMKLVKYRLGTGLIHQSKHSYTKVERRRRGLHHRIDTLEQRRLDVAKCNHIDSALLLKVLNEELSKAQARLEFYDRPLVFILQLLCLNGLHYLKALSSETKYILGLIK